MELKIYNKSGNLILTASPNSSSSLSEEIGGECSVSVSFTHTQFVMLDVDCYIEIEGVRYKIKSGYRPKQKNTQTYEYNVKFYAPIHDAEDTLMLFMEGGTTSEFSFDGSPREHLQLWIDNMNRTAGSELWSIGTVITSDNKSITYQKAKCWDAAFGSNGIAATFDTEMWADGYVINLCKASRGEIVELGYMQGLTNLTPEDNGEIKFFTRLFPLGSTRNIDASKYGYSRLQLPDRSPYVDKNVDLYGVKEETEEAAFSQIYPKYIGTVSSVRTEELENEDGRKYTVYYIKDEGMNWNPKDYEIPDLDYILQFQTGELAGRGTDGSFQAAWHEDTREWEIINVYPDDTTQIPGGAIVPKPGDQYIPWNFALPQEYITAAEQEYKQAVDDYLATYSFDPNKYTGTTDRNFVEKNGTPLKLGWNVRLLSEQYFANTGGYKDTRIIKVVRKLNDLCQGTITCSDQVGTGWKTSVDNQLNNLQYVLSRQEEQALIDIIKTTDNKTPSDYNVLSALKSIGMFLRKDKADSTRYLLTMLAGAQFGNFTSGLLGTGGAVQIDEDGNSRAEFDYLTIRKIALFIELLVQEMKYVGGAFIVTPSGMKVSRVEEQETSYRCYFEASDGDRTVNNQFTVGAQARRQTFNLTDQAYYWRLVTEVGKDYIDLSKTDCDSGSTIPQPGDEIVGLGHRTDKTRQSAIIISAFGTDAPSIKYYQGIDNYSLEDKLINADYYDQTTGRFKSVTYGDKFIGEKDSSTYFDFVSGKGVKVKGEVEITGGKGWKNLEGLDGAIGDAVTAAQNAQNTADSVREDAASAAKEASEANNRLEEWAKDSIISPTEKVALKQELANLQSEYQTNVENAKKYGIDTAAYTSAWTAYKAELEYHSTDSPENIPIRNTFKTSQNTFYTSRENLLIAIAEAAKEYADKIVANISVGAENLLLNTGFTGNYDYRDLSSGTSLSGKTYLYSNRFENWGGTGTIIEDSNSASGFACVIGSLNQSVNLINGEKYVISYKAKGSSVTVSVGSSTFTDALTSEYKTYHHKMEFTGGNLFVISGNATVCEIKLERGTVATDWCPSRRDRNEVADMFKNYWYLQDAIKGSTEIIGGLILSTMIQLGKWTDGKMDKVNAGISGIYNDDTDIAVWSGGTYQEAIATVQKILNGEDPTDDEWKSMAKFVATHGGDIFLRGYIYALGGIFRGRVETRINGNRIVIDPSDSSLKMYNNDDKLCLNLSFSEMDNGRIFAGLNIVEYEGDTPFYTASVSGRLISFSNLIDGYSGFIGPDRLTFSNGREDILNMSVLTNSEGKKYIDISSSSWNKNEETSAGSMYVDQNGFVKVKQ